MADANRSSSNRAVPARSHGWRVWLVACAALLGLGAAAATPDLPAATLVAKYGAAPSHFLHLPSGARVHYRDQGNPEAPVLLLLHGSNSSLHTWEPWVARLSDVLRVITLDLPGHGLTGPVPGDDYTPDAMASFLDGFRQKLGLTHFHLAGNSMGGNIAWRYTLAHPQVVDRLVLVDAAGVNHLLPESVQPHMPFGMRLARTPGLNGIIRFVTPRRIVEGSLRSTFVDQSKVSAAMIDRYYELLLYPGNRRATQLRGSAPLNNAPAARLAEIKAPTLILWGQRDTLIPVEAARIFQQHIPGAQRIEYPDVGHIPMEEVADRSAADVRRFLLASR